MHELHRDLRVVLVDARGEFLESGQKLVARHCHLVFGVRAERVLDRADFGDDQSGAAAGALLVVGDQRFADVPVGINDFDAHRRHCDAVRDFERADLERREQFFVHRGLLGRTAANRAENRICERRSISERGVLWASTCQAGRVPLACGAERWPSGRRQRS